MAGLREKLSDGGAALYERIRRWWFSLTPRGRWHVSTLCLLMVGSIAHFLVFTVYYIEDSGISFAFARNFVEGEGWVAWAGGERVEGFSNPLWTWLVAAFYAIGVSPWTSSKVMGAVFGAACIPMSYLLSRACRPGREDNLDLLAPFFLAASSTAAIWHGSGLENGLFSILLTGGMLLVLREADGDGEGLPYSALCFLGLALTRPEGILYAALAGMVRLGLAIKKGHVIGPIVRWLVVFWVPFAVYQAWRYDYFAWAWPNTYYAKLDGENRFQPWRWNTRGWKYITNYLKGFGFAYWLPLIPIGLLGLRRRWRWFIVGLTVLGAAVFMWDGKAGLPPDFDPTWHHQLTRHWDKIRTGLVIAAVAGVGVGTALRRGAAARLLVMAMTCAGLFFALYSGGDWMAQWRFISYIIVPAAVLIGLGTATLLESLPGLTGKLGRVPVRGLVTGALLVAMASPNIWNSIWSAPTPETTVADVHRRVKYMTWVQNRLHLERVTLWDVDMGAHMYFTDWKILDIAGLVDVPMSRHVYQKDFIREYMFNEHKPTFAHMHGGWASKVKVTSHPEWRRDYIEIRGYPAGRKSFHVGNHIRKDIFIRDAYMGPPGVPVKFGKEVVLEGMEMPSDVVPAGGAAYVELWLKAGFKKSNFRMLIILDDKQGNQHVAALPPGYDWYEPSRWRSSEHLVHRYDFDLPATLPEGQYDIGVVLLDVKTGRVIPAEGSEDAEPRYMKGEHFMGPVVNVVSREEATREADEDRTRAEKLAAEGKCELAWGAWRQARYHIWRNKAYREQHGADVERQTALCYAERAATTEDVQARAELLVQARGYDHRVKGVTGPARTLAAEFDREGDEAWAVDDAEAAYVAWDMALALDPRLSSTRRKAEEARDLRLGIESKVKDSVNRSSSKKDKDEEKKDEEKKDEEKKDEEPGEVEGQEAGAVEGDEDAVPGAIKPRDPRTPGRRIKVPSKGVQGPPEPPSKGE